MVSLDEKCEVLSQLWEDFREEEDWEGFISSQDVGLPLAWLLYNGVVSATEQAQQLINGTWSELLQKIGLPDGEFEEVYALVFDEPDDA